MKTGLYVRKVQRVEVVLTFLVGGLNGDTTETELYDMLEGIAKGHEGQHVFDRHECIVILESAKSSTKRMAK